MRLGPHVACVVAKAALFFHFSLHWGHTTPSMIPLNCEVDHHFSPQFKPSNEFPFHQANLIMACRFCPHFQPSTSEFISYAFPLSQSVPTPGFLVCPQTNQDLLPQGFWSCCALCWESFSSTYWYSSLSYSLHTSSQMSLSERTSLTTLQKSNSRALCFLFHLYTLPFSWSLLTFDMLYIYLCIFSLFHKTEFKEGRTLFCSLLYPQCIQQCTDNKPLLKNQWSNIHGEETRT